MKMLHENPSDSKTTTTPQPQTTSTAPLTSRIDHAVVVVGIVVRSLVVIAPVARAARLCQYPCASQAFMAEDLQRMRCSTGTRNSKRQDEHNDLCASVHCCREQVVVLEVPSWVLPADVVLSDKTKDEVDGHTGVDADAEVAEVPADQGGVKVV